MRLDSSLKIKDFREMTDEWLDFIINCRAGKIHDYDIVIGADGRMIQITTMFLII